MQAKYDKPTLADYLSRDHLTPQAFMNYGLTTLRRAYTSTHHAGLQLSFFDLLSGSTGNECLAILEQLPNEDLETALPAPYLAHFLQPHDGAVIGIAITTAHQATISPHDKHKRHALICSDSASTALLLSLSPRFQLANTGKQVQAHVHLQPGTDIAALPCILALEYGFVYCKLDSERYTLLLRNTHGQRTSGLSLHRANGIYSLPQGNTPEKQLGTMLFHVPAVPWA